MNKEQQKITDKIRYDRNRKIILEQHKIKYIQKYKNNVDFKLKHKKYYLKNKDNISKKGKEYYIKNKLRISENSKKYNINNKDKRLNISLIRRYGITLDEYTKILIKQNYKCAICKVSETVKHQSGNIKKLSVDHCHKTNKIRGLLCSKCNFSLGGFNDNIEILSNAIEYLKQN